MKTTPEEFAETFATNRAKQLGKIFENEDMIATSVGHITLELFSKDKSLTLDLFVEEVSRRLSVRGENPYHEQDAEWHRLQAVLRALQSL